MPQHSGNQHNFRTTRYLASVNAAGGKISVQTANAIDREFFQAFNRHPTLPGKTRELWLAVGENTASALRKAIWASNPALTNNGLTLTYSEAAGLQGNSAATGRLNTGFVPSSNGLSRTNHGYAVYTLNNYTAGTPLGTGDIGGSVTGATFVGFKSGSTELSAISGAQPTHSLLRSLRSLHAQGGNAISYNRGNDRATIPLPGSGGDPTQEVVLLNHRNGGDTFPSNALLGGYWVGEGLTRSEAGFLSSLYDNLFLKINRTAGISFCFFGDSITVGTGASSSTTKYSSLIANSLGVTEINSGIGGTVLQNTAPNLANNGRNRYVSAVYDQTPSKVFILYGLNDVRYNDAAFTTATYKANLDFIVSDLISRGVRPDDILIGSPPYVNPSTYSSNAPFNGGSTIRHEAHVQAALEVAQDRRTKYVDIYSAMLNGGGNALLSADGVHPNDTGHRLIANAFLSALVEPVAATAKTITRSGSDITISEGYTQNDPCTWELIFQADVAGGWGQITKLGTAAYRINGGRVLFDGWITDTSVYVEFANNAVPIWRNNGGCRFGNWDAALRLASAGCTFLFSTRTTNFNDAYPAIFNDSANCSFNGCKIILDLDPNIGTPTTDSRRMDFSVTPGDGWGSATIPSSTTVLNMRGCDFLVQSGFCVTHLYQNASSEVINTQFFAGSKGLHFFERLSGGTFSGLRLASNIVSGFSASTTPFVFDRFVFLTTAQSVLRSARHDVLDPTFTGGQTKLVVTTPSQRPFTSNSRARQQYRYSLRCNAFLGSGINDARLAIFDSTSTQVAYLSSDGSGVFATQNITRWQWVRQSDTVAAESSLGPHSYVLGKYGRQRISYTYDNLNTQPIAETKELQSVSVVLSEAAAAAINWVSVNHGSNLITVSGSNRSMSDIHDYLQWLCVQDGQMQFPVLASKEGASIVGPYNWSFAASYTEAFTLVLAASRTLTLTQAGSYGFSATIPATGTVVVPGSGAAVSLLNFEFAPGATINRSGSGAATVTVAAGQAANISAGTGVVIVEPQVSLTATNFANGTRVQVSRVESFTVAETAINTTADTIALTGNQFRSTSFPTLVRFAAATGATLPTSTPQIENGGLYYVVSVSGANIQLSETQAGTALNFTAAGSGSFTFQGITELDNSVVSGGAGYSIALSQANGTLLRVRARHWTAGAASRFFDQTYVWSATAGVTIPDTLSASATPDTIHNAIISADYVIAPNGTQFSTTNDGSAVTGLTVDADGVVEIDINDPDGQLLIQDAYCWFVYTSSTQSGIRLISSDNFLAEDLFNYVLTRIRLESVSASPVQVVGGYLRSGDGSQLITPQSNALHLNAFEKGVAIATSTSGSSLTLAEIEASTVLAKRVDVVNVQAAIAGR